MLKVKILKIDSKAKVPFYAHEGDAGFDLHSIENCTLNPGEKKVIRTGLKMEIISGYFGSIRDKSGLAAKFGIHVLAGVIDSGYRGEICIALINLGKEEFEINIGDKIAQMLIQKVECVEFEEVEELSETSRGSGGFGSTGK